ncbi:uncharacterized protein LOC117590734 [Drosophila guanche]|uniref:Uncharacterized protein n=2 Tax=Drosophila guanche TaxID=7266 RepID=A0A3B0KTA9_DROGU|nr:uncharacterized protein LOC117590734 [Drosophila guanche]SPP89096.1 Hypothetical predicted protein [Drosophila guanche]
MSSVREMSEMSVAILVGAVAILLGVALYIIVKRRRRLSSALVPYARRSLVRVPNETEDQKELREYLRERSRFIHHPPVDLGNHTMPREFQVQMKIIVRMQAMYRDGLLFPHRLPPLQRWARC